MNTKRLTLTALLASLALVLSFVEGQFIIIPACPGVKLGLSNIAVMFSLLFIDRKTAFGIAVVKALFALATRGAMAGALSLTGGVFSIAVISLLLLYKGATLSLISLSGALSHNLAQFTLVRFVYGGASFLPYLPLLIVAGAVFGIMNALLLKAVTPAFRKIWRKE